MFKIEELLPCPFCGSQPEIVHLVHPSGVPGIRCTFCHFIIKADRHDKVVGMWNSRKGYKKNKQRVSFVDAYDMFQKMIVNNNDPNYPSDTYVEDYAGGSRQYIRDDIIIALIRKLTR